jgi:hypothetical protein
MKIKFKALASFAIVSVSALILGSCTSNADSPGLEYMPDMYRSPAIEPYVDYGEVRGRINEDLKLHQSALTPPAGTVPYYGTDSSLVQLMLPYFRKANISFRETHGLYGADLAVSDEYTLAAADVNPLKLTKDNSEASYIHFIKVNPKNVLLNSANANITRKLTISDSSASLIPGVAILGPNAFVINHRLFELNYNDYNVPLNNTEIWEITSTSVFGHPFHIHDVEFNI